MNLYRIVHLHYRFTEGPNAHCLFVAVFPVIIYFRYYVLLLLAEPGSLCHSLEYVDMSPFGLSVVLKFYHYPEL